MEGDQEVFYKNDVGAWAAAGFSYVEVGSVSVAYKCHVVGAVGDAVVGISGKVIKELEHVPVCAFGG